jgi:hypothetical protein
MREEPPALGWPRLLELPSDSVNVVYLDLNHWIYPAQAMEIRQFDKMADEDQSRFIGELIVEAEKVF